MANLNLNAKKKHTYDAIVIGSGISGGWAAFAAIEKTAMHKNASNTLIGCDMFSPNLYDRTIKKSAREVKEQMC